MEQSQIDQPNNQQSRKPGFWRRSLAFVIDTILISVPLYIFGWIFYDFFASIGPWGRMLGIFPALFYFGLLNSEHGQGQTIGKRIFGLRVLNKENKQITLGQSLARYSVLLIPLHLSGINFDIDESSVFWMAPLFLITVSAFVGFFFYHIFNFANRENLHDFLTGTHVANASGTIDPPTTPRWLHYIFAGICVVLLSFVTFQTYQTLSGQTTETAKRLISIQEIVSQHPAVRTSGVSIGTQYNKSRSEPGHSFEYISITVWPTVDQEEFEPEISKLFQTLKAEAPYIMDYHVISIHVVTGFQFGFARYSKTTNHRHSPSEWEELSSSEN